MVDVRTMDHPRVCGEKIVVIAIFYPLMGSPPRMRGKDSVCNESAPLVGITPAYAGKSCRVADYRQGPWDHPRVCGEKQRTLAVQDEPQGSPPRMRGKDSPSFSVKYAPRITPAYAGKRNSFTKSFEEHGDHPRVCGEKTKKIPSHRPFQLHPVPVSFSFA